MTNPGNKVFLSGENPVLEVLGVSEPLTVIYKVDNTMILQENYIPSDNRVYIRDIAKLAQAYFKDPSPLVDVGISCVPIILMLALIADNNTFNISVTVYPCDTETMGTLSVDNLMQMPLSRVTEKKTATGRFELLSFYGYGLKLMAGIAYTYLGRTRYARVTLLNNTKEGYKAVDVSPSKMVQLVAKSSNRHVIKESDIVYYDIYGGLEFRYQMLEFPTISQQCFVFVNSFHALETFTCSGDVESERKWNRTEGVSNNHTVLVAKNLTRTNTVYTGYLSEGDCEVLEDLLNSAEVCLVAPTGYMPVIITNESFKITNRLDDVIAASFEYKFASSNQMQYRFKPRQLGVAHIFDHSFNESFN